MPSESVLARIAEFLETIWEHPSAAAQFVESPDTALASQGLSQSDLQGVDLSAVAGGLAGAGGMSPEGQRVLTDFAQRPGPSGHYGGTPVQQIGHATRAVHHDNPTVQKVFIDNQQTFNIDNSVNFNNNGGVINGDVTLSNNADTTIATGRGTALGPAARDNVIAGPGGVAAGNGGPDLSFGDGATPGQADHHSGQSDHGGNGLDGQNQDDPQEENRNHQQGGQDHDLSNDPTAAAPDPTLIEGHEDQHDAFQVHPGVDDFDHTRGAQHGSDPDSDHV